MVKARGMNESGFPYDEFVRSEGIPVHEERIGISDVTALARGDWRRTGGRGCYITLRGSFEAQRGIYVCEVPSGVALEAERHLYEEQLVVLVGAGRVEVWKDSRSKAVAELGSGTVCAFPRNTWHRMVSTGDGPLIFMGVTTAPAVINMFDDLDFTFNCPYDFGIEDWGPGYYTSPDLETVEGWYSQTIVHTNFIPDVHSTRVDRHEQKVAGGGITGYRMGATFPHGHVSAWPKGRYHKAHYHQPGSILLGLGGMGYVLAWPLELGPRPYASGHTERVVRLDWGPNSIYTPPDGWFHQHFNTGHLPASHVAVYGPQLPLGIHGLGRESGWAGHLTYREGGTLVEYADEDPKIRSDFANEISARGIALEMPLVEYNDALDWPEIPPGRA